MARTPARARPTAGPPDGDDAEAILDRALQGRYRVRRSATTDEVLSHLDTADGRLRKAGFDLVSDAKASGLWLYRTNALPVHQPSDVVDFPAPVAAIGAGPVRDLVSGPAWIRALVPFATSEARRTRFDVLNEDDKTVARVQWRQGSIVGPVATSLPVDVSVEALKGYGREADEVERLLGAGVAISAAGQDWLAAVRALAGSTTTAGRRFGMHPDHAADLAVADALLGDLDKMEANVDGVLADTDTEYLHQLRVEVRRSRSILKLLGDVLPDPVAVRAAGDLRWLGTATTPTRDLDVYLLEIDELAEMIERRDDLTPLAEHIRERRTAEQAALVAVLASPRFAGFRARWRSELAGVVSSHSRSPIAVSQLADERIGQMFRKVRKRANAITTESSGEEIHALRKACKEMRYLLELFRPLCQPTAYRAVIADFKDLQEVLGEFQDGEVQAAALRVFAREMLEAGDVDTDTILAMGALSAHFETRQAAARATLTQRRGGYVGDRVASHVRRLLTP